MEWPIENGSKVPKAWQPMSAATCRGPSSCCTSVSAEKTGRSGQPIQKPGGRGAPWGGRRQNVPTLPRAAPADGIAAVFIETHENPDTAPSDGPNMVPLDKLEELMRQIMAIDKLAKSFN